MRHPTTGQSESVTVLGALLLAAPALAQYREYYIRGKVVDTQKKPIAGVEIDAPRRRHEPQLPHEDGQEGRVQVRRPAPRHLRGDLRQGGLRPRARTKWKFEAPQDTMQSVEIPDVVLASQEQVQEVAAPQGGRGRGQGGGREAPAGRLRRRDRRAQGPARQEPRGRRTPSSSSGSATPESRCIAEADGPVDAGHGAEPRVPRRPLRAGRLLPGARRPARRRSQPSRRPSSSTPRTPTAAYNAGLILFETNRIDEALARFEQGLASKPQDPDLLEMAGRCYIHEAKFQRAVERLEKARALTTDPAKLAFLDELIRKAEGRSLADDVRLNHGPCPG